MLLADFDRDVDEHGIPTEDWVSRVDDPVDAAAAPEYARPRLARELHDLLTELEAQAARESDLAARRNQPARDRAWVADERSG